MAVDRSTALVAVSAMHALTQLVVCDLLTDATQRPALVEALTGSSMQQMKTFDHSKPDTYKTCTCRSYGAHVKALLTHVSDGPDATEEVAELAYETWAFFYTVTSAFADARRMFEGALAIRLKLQVHNADSVGVADCCSYLGLVCAWIRLTLQGHNADSVGVTDCYNYLGLVCACLGKYEEALEMHQKALQIKIKVFDHDHMDVDKIKVFDHDHMHDHMDVLHEHSQCLQQAGQVKRST